MKNFLVGKNITWKIYENKERFSFFRELKTYSGKVVNNDILDKNVYIKLKDSNEIKILRLSYVKKNVNNGFIKIEEEEKETE